MQILQLNHKIKALVLKKDLTIKSDLIYEYFKKLPQDLREKMFKKALYIGVMALIEERISTFLAKTKNELGTELERLKILFDMQAEIFSKSAVKGKYAERDLVQILNDYFEEKGWKDYAILVGDNVGKLPQTKTGDIMAYIDGQEKQNIIIEVKFTERLPIGDIAETDLKKNTNNIWGQLLESKVNREAKEAIIVFDKTLASELYNKLGPTTYIPNVGYVTFIDMNAGNYIPLFSVYNIIRSAITELANIKIKKEPLYRKIILRVLKQAKNLLKIQDSINNNIKNNQKILKQIEKEINDIQITKHYLEKLLKNDLDTNDLLDFLTGKM